MQGPKALLGKRGLGLELGLRWSVWMTAFHSSHLEPPLVKAQGLFSIKNQGVFTDAMVMCICGHYAPIGATSWSPSLSSCLGCLQTSILFFKEVYTVSIQMFTDYDLVSLLSWILLGNAVEVKKSKGLLLIAVCQKQNHLCEIIFFSFFEISNF